MSVSKPSWRVAVIGAGYFSQFHLAGWTALPNVEVVGICDMDTAKAEAMAARYNVAQTFGSIDELLDKARPDLVDIVTAPTSHAAILDATLERRLATICQKPFCTDFWQAEHMAERAQGAGVPVVVHENFRFMPWFREVKRLLDQGMLGQPYSVNFRLRPGDGQGSIAYMARQPYFQQMPRFMVKETAVHFIDTFRFLFGEVSGVYARLRRLNPVIKGEDAAIICLEFPDNTIGQFDGNRLVDHVCENPRRTLGEMWLEGSAGVLRLDGYARLWFKPHGQTEVEHVYDRGSEVEFGGGACGRLQAHVIDALEKGHRPENTASDYLANLLVQEAVYHSHLNGCRVDMATFRPSRDLASTSLFG
ncbi:Gfo/Idh/MocA family oxidoreductase [Burkholderia sp. Ax-1724]|uniref:Gfo/Idh/MocA family protein n=1 Tax=Burkholderia sp. Ax-1724 TaxID=2608336 RepID=UPI00141F3D14|nr:Gfo/Idh/MocA family oxidoreductase [Burkholderia sp. Ax-1724]NIF52287.1 Gfo/Idh/MocA family oxidoreductase [Burkholderia sp. Ax-1724]